MTPVDLKCDYRVNPLAVELEHPGFSWTFACDRPGAAQMAYQIQASDSEKTLDDAELWDSGWVESSETTQVLYDGKSVSPTRRVYWRVRVKDEQGGTSDWSAPAWFETGLKTDAEWQGAKWISCTRERTAKMAPEELVGPWIGSEDENGPGSVTFRYSFEAPDKPVVYAGAWWGTTGSSRNECSVNGQCAGFDSHDKAPQYTDFSFFVHPGKNDIALYFPDSPKNTAITFGMKIVFADGTEQLVRSSEVWNVETGEKAAGKKKPAGTPCSLQVICDYGKKPLGTADVYSTAPLPVTWYKTDFTLKKRILSARLYLCGLGYSEPYLNGEKVGDHVLDPSQSDYEHEAFYQAFDVTDQLSKGKNALAVLLADGWYNEDRGFCRLMNYGKPGLRALLKIRLSDGSEQIIVSNEEWQWRESETQLSNLYLGDCVDFRLSNDDWKEDGFSKHWKPVQPVPPLSPKLKAQTVEPIRKGRTVEPTRIWQIGEKTWGVDLGQNISGWVRLKFNEPEGSVVRVRCTEELTPYGDRLDNVPLSFWGCHGAPQNHQLICDGKPHEWEPKFSYHGFRYFEVSGLSQPPQPGDLLGVVVHTDVPVAATFDSSDPLLNRIFQMGLQTHQNNMHSFLEDCPHREKTYWGGDLHASWATGFTAFDSTAFYRHCVNLFYVPPFDRRGIPGNVGVGRKRLAVNICSDFTWPVSPLFIAWRLYEMDGELETTRSNYVPIKNFLQYFETNSPDLIPKDAQYGDHAAPPEIRRADQNRSLIAAMNFYAACDRFSRLAAALGNSNDAEWAKMLAGRIRESVLSKYYDAAKHTFGNGTQDSLALAFNLVEPGERKALAESLADVYRNNGAAFDGGFMSYNIYPQLAENGYVDLALKILRNDKAPGIAWSVRNFDATTIWEMFTRNPDFRRARSHDHHAMNHPTAWMITHLAGIQATHQKLVLAPNFPADLDWASASVETHRGTIKSSWKKTDGRIEWNIVVPPNCSAEIRFPENSDKPPETVSAGKYCFDWPCRP